MEVIKITQTDISTCVASSQDLLDESVDSLKDAREAYSNVSYELSRLDSAHERLTTFVDGLAQDNIDLRPLVDQATEHARQLQIQADELDR